MSTVVRENSDQFFVGYLKNSVKQIIDDIRSDIPQKKLIDIYSDIHKNKDYSFMCIRCDKHKNDGFIRKNFDQIYTFDDTK